MIVRIIVSACVAAMLLLGWSVFAWSGDVYGSFGPGIGPDAAEVPIPSAFVSISHVEGLSGATIKRFFGVAALQFLACLALASLVAAASPPGTRLPRRFLLAYGAVLFMVIATQGVQWMASANREPWASIVALDTCLGWGLASIAIAVGVAPARIAA